jgi:hypothetical protein
MLIVESAAILCEGGHFVKRIKARYRRTEHGGTYAFLHNVTRCVAGRLDVNAVFGDADGWRMRGSGGCTDS